MALACAVPAVAAIGYPNGVPALDGVHLDVADGARVAVLGPNGAGKTTLMLHLNGLPFAGQLCERAVLLSGGRVVADRAVGNILDDAALLVVHDLELPAGFDLTRLQAA